MDGKMIGFLHDITRCTDDIRAKFPELFDSLLSRTVMKIRSDRDPDSDRGVFFAAFDFETANVHVFLSRLDMTALYHIFSEL